MADLRLTEGGFTRGSGGLWTPRQAVGGGGTGVPSGIFVFYNIDFRKVGEKAVYNSFY